MENGSYLEVSLTEGKVSVKAAGIDGGQLMRVLEELLSNPTPVGQPVVLPNRSHWAIRTRNPNPTEREFLTTFHDEYAKAFTTKEPAGALWFARQRDAEAIRCSYFKYVDVEVVEIRVHEETGWFYVKEDVTHEPVQS